MIHGTTLPDRTTNNKGRQPQPPLIPTGLTINTTHINFETVKGHHSIASIKFWTKKVFDNISVKCMVQEIVDKIYVKELDEDYIGYNNQTRKIILTHLKKNWCIIIPLEKRRSGRQFPHST